FDRATSKLFFERAARDVLHHERGGAGVLDPVDLGDIWVIERCERLRLALEPRDAIGVVRQALRQDLDRDVAIEARIASAIHLAHSTFADLGKDLEWPKCLSNHSQVLSMAMVDPP